MFKDSIIIFKKELKSLFKDRRSILFLIILPLVLMPGIFLTIGYTASSQERKAAETVYKVGFINLPDENFPKILSERLLYEGFYKSKSSIDFSEVTNSDRTVIVEFSSDNGKLTARIYYNSVSNKSKYAMQVIISALNAYEKLLLSNKLRAYSLTLDDLRLINISSFDLAPEEARGTDFLAVMLPYMILIYIFAGSMNIGLDTTAGEKERGTLSPILVNQVSRTSIATGKVFYVMTAGLINSLSTFVGLVIAFSIVGNLPGSSLSMNISALTPLKLFWLLITILTVAGLASSVMVLLGSLAKSMKEGGAYVMPFYIGAIIMGVATMQMDSSKNLTVSLIPLLNSVFNMKDIITSQFSAIRFLLMILTNLAVMAIVIILTARLYNSEKILESSE
ncbi:sodium ABC transporter permease [Kosmotoga arenicorallina S304]|uniref:Sodium ABC transporter permease n=1 Tax=Kosmotoga arenicorallina S304 TaxID=1453497 RepID=A0A182C7C9_9BACT|nr:ABC transporter permease [Kosmotoga arenicorallina]OAA31451.1 sodium ABC transporter permease [Kosmotoga arenicorallina S304]